MMEIVMDPTFCCTLFQVSAGGPRDLLKVLSIPIASGSLQNCLPKATHLTQHLDVKARLWNPWVFRTLSWKARLLMGTVVLRS